MNERLPPQRGLHPHPSLPDREWERILKILRADGTMTSAVTADKLDRQIQDFRQRRAAHLAGDR